MKKTTQRAAACAVFIGLIALPASAHPHKDSASGDSIVNTVTHDHAGGVVTTNACVGKNSDKETSADDCTVSPVSTH
ncbi:hypothetical protein L4D15_02205 [Enterovibrio norvegicus]|uniref:hypothetical protein n=1 Tax=Enterovibrio norvegicus TaxID=188144 RepID=UPI003D1380E8